MGILVGCRELSFAHIYQGGNECHLSFFQFNISILPNGVENYHFIRNLKISLLVKNDLRWHNRWESRWKFKMVEKATNSNKKNIFILWIYLLKLSHKTGKIHFKVHISWVSFLFITATYTIMNKFSWSSYLIYSG